MIADFKSHFIEQLLSVVQHYPNHIALEEEGHYIPYHQLHQRIQQVGSFLIEQNFPTNSGIVISIDKSADYIIALLAVWWSGHYFIPLSTDLPPKRQQYILQQSQAVAILTNHTDNNFDKTSEIPKLDLSRQSQLLHPPVYDLKHLAYIFYTSGSTGQPKGVMVQHRGLCNVLQQQIAYFELDASSRSLFFLNTLFDASISDIGTALLSGASLVFPTQHCLSSISSIQQYLLQKQISYVDIPPSILSMLDTTMHYPNLKTIVIGGETVAKSTVSLWKNKVKLIVVYGPTEASICTSMLDCSTVRWNHNYIGRPIDGIDYRIDARNELYISGVGLAEGYWQQPVLTASKFVNIDGQLYFRTGDMVERDASGNYVFRGRLDRQFKINGKLIAPEEIESHIKNIEGIVNAVVVKENNHLVALIQSKHPDFSLMSINDCLKPNLPSWMLPHKLVINNVLPKAVNGKTKLAIDVQDPMLKQIKQHWLNILQVDDCSVFDSFESLGGTSLGRMQLLAVLSANNIPMKAADLTPATTLYDCRQCLGNQTQDVNRLNQIAHDFVDRCMAQFSRSEQVQIADNRAANPCVFITGATGFLGSNLLVELLENTTDSICCLLRCTTKAAGRQRLILHTDVDAQTIDKRIRIIPGDLLENDWGIALEDMTYLQKNVHTIYHCAANISTVADLQSMLAINVHPLSFLMQLMQEGCRKTLHYASTLSVFVASDYSPGLCRETEAIKDVQEVYGAYAQSKWIAEKAVFAFKHQLGLDIKVYRLGLLTGHQRHGKGPQNDLLGMFIRAMNQVKIAAVEAKQLAVDITPVDWAAHCMHHIAAANLQQHSVFHIANQSALTYAELVEFYQQMGKDLSWQSIQTLDAMASSFDYPLYGLLLKRKHRRDGLDLFQATDFQFVQDNTMQVLADKYRCPAIDAVLIQQYIHHYLKDTDA